MVAYTPIPNSDIDSESPITVSLMTSLRDNLQAAYEGNAPFKLEGSAIASAAIHQSHLSFSTEEFTTAFQETFLLSGGGFSFLPQSKLTGNADDASIKIFESSSFAYQTFVTLNSLGASSSVSLKNRYVNTSPPHFINGIEYQNFIFLKVNSSGKILSVTCADDPPWLHNGPTRCVPDLIQGGKKYLYVKPSDEIKPLKELSPLDYKIALLDVETELVELTTDIKNCDMSLVPHPFAGLDAGEQALLIAPESDGYDKLCRLAKVGESIGDIVMSGFTKFELKKSQTLPIQQAIISFKS